MPDRRPRFPRRALVLGGAGALLAGCSRGDLPGGEGSGGDGSGTCRTPGELVGFSTVGTGELGYEIGRVSPSTMKAEPAFLEQLQAWAEDWAALSGLGAITAVWSYGAFVDRCSSWHQVGRAFDFAEVVHESGSVSCRFDEWGPGSAGQLRDYWRLAASLHQHFAYTLTYLYNEAHHNHIHVDNSVSGASMSSFDERSGAQVSFVQAACLHVHGEDAGATGEYDDATRAAVRAVQRAAGITRPLADQEGWTEFLRATAAA